MQCVDAVEQLEDLLAHGLIELFDIVQELLEAIEERIEGGHRVGLYGEGRLRAHGDATSCTLHIAVPPQPRRGGGRGTDMNGWLIGWAIGGAVVVVVVALLLLMIRGASLAVDKAEEIVAALQDAHRNTAGLWKVNQTNVAAERIVGAAAAAREALAGGDGS